MMSNKKVFFLICICLVSFLKAGNDIVISHGWNLIGSSYGVDLSETFQSPAIKTIWIWDKGEWAAYSPDKTIQKKIQKSFKLITTTNPFQGFWVYSSIGPLSIKLIELPPLPGDSGYITDNLRNGWNLLGSSVPIDLNKTFNSYEYKVVFAYQSGQWMFYSSRQDIVKKLNKKFPFITKIQNNQGFWVYYESVSPDLPSFSYDNGNENVYDTNTSILQRAQRSIYITYDKTGKVIETNNEKYKYDKNGNIMAIGVMQ